ncbi:hypothetical protein [Bacillus sp. JJ722]|uniref:hypothetical protein n=1 Tax=Bacillus sp. JJ722 TaxID=3122973 RepID=UPI002FFD9A29
MFTYFSCIGVMKIYLDQYKHQFALSINDTVYGYYHSAGKAADDVYCHVTGCYDWDLLEGTINDVPTNLYEWQPL